jgi:hypothetical protein
MHAKTKRLNLPSSHSSVCLCVSELFGDKQAKANASLTMTVLNAHGNSHQYLTKPQLLIRHQITPSIQLGTSISALTNHASH